MNTQQATILQQLLEKIDQKANLSPAAKLGLKYFSAKSKLQPVPVAVGAEESGRAIDEKTKVSMEATENLFHSQLVKNQKLRLFLKEVVHRSVFPVSKDSTPIDFEGKRTSTSILSGATICWGLFHSFELNEFSKNFNAHWLHSIKRSVAARAIGRKMKEIGTDQVFCVSLFFDVGKMAFLAQLGKNYVGFLNKAKKEGVSVLAMELASLGFDHRVIGAKLLQHWEGSAEGVDAILAAHGDADAKGLPQMTKVLLAAEAVADSLTPGYAMSSKSLLSSVKKYIGWESHDVEALVKAVEKPARLLTEQLGLELPADAFPAPPEILHPKTPRPKTKPAAPSSPKAKQQPKVEPKQEAAPKPEVEKKTPPQNTAPSTSTFDKKAPEASSPAIEKVVDNRLSELDQQFKKWQDEEEGKKEEVDPVVSEVQKWTGSRQFTGTVAAALRQCRDSHKELGLVLLEIDRFEDLLFAESIEDIYQIQKKVRAALQALADKDGGIVSEISDERFAVVLPQRDLTQTARFGKTALQLLRSWSAMRMKQGHGQVTFSIGSVTAAFLNDRIKPLHLIQGAQRCLGAVKLQSGNGHKSISLLG